MNLPRLASRLPVPAYFRTFAWAKAMRRNPATWHETAEWPYWNAVELAMLAVARNYATALPSADSYSMLEFGVAGGGSLERMLRYRDVQARRLGVTKPIRVYGFDTFQGMPAAREGDDGLPYVPGDYYAGREHVERYIAGYSNVQLVPGLFSDTLPGYWSALDAAPPIFVSLDCDWYSSTVEVLDELADVLPHGCVLYFDDVGINFYSTKTGQMRAIREINSGRYGDGVELVEVPMHQRYRRQLYRWVNLERARVQNETLVEREPDLSLIDPRFS